MLGRLVLIVLQALVAWYGAPYLMKHIPVSGDLRIFALAAVFAVLVFLTGILGAEVLKEVNRPPPQALPRTLLFALIGAALLLIPQQYWAMIPLRFDRQIVPLIAAIIGYMTRR